MGLDILIVTHEEFHFGSSDLTVIPTAAFLDIDFLIPILEDETSDIDIKSWTNAQGNRKIFHVLLDDRDEYHPNEIDAENFTYIESNQIPKIMDIILNSGMKCNWDQVTMLASLASTLTYLVLFYK